MSGRRLGLLLALGGVLAAGGVAGWRWWATPAAAVLTASGTVEATEVQVSFRIPGRVAERRVGEGDRIERGALVARLESRELEAEVERLRAALAATRSQLPQLETEIALRVELTRRRVTEAEAVLAARQARLAELESGARPQEIAEAEAGLQAREARLAELRRGARPQEIQQAEAEAREARAVRDNARVEFERMDQLATQGIVAAQARDAARTALDVAGERLTHALERLALVREGPRVEEIRRAAAEVRQAEAALALVRAGPRPEEIRRAAAEVRQAEAALHVAQAGELEVTLTRQRLATLQANVARDQAALRAAETQLGYTAVESPETGVVLRKHVEPGETVVAGTPVVTVADLEQSWVKVYVPEPALGRVKRGQAADVTTDSYPGRVYRGTVTFISSEAEFTPKSIYTPEERVKLVFAVKVTVENPRQELKPGMPADVRFHLD
jgi:HlyD family secretion protein